MLASTLGEKVIPPVSGVEHVLDLGCWVLLDVPLSFQVVKEGLESLQQVIDIPGLPVLVIHHCQEHFDVGCPDLFHTLDVIFLFQIVL